jgi:hypothetical protein
MAVELDPDTNYAPDPGFESGVLRHDYSFVDTGVTDASRVQSARTISGDFSLLLDVAANASAGTNNGLVMRGWWLPTEPGQPWSASLMAAYCSAQYKAGLWLHFYNAARSIALGTPGTTYGPTAARDPHQLQLLNQVAPPDSAWLRLNVMAVIATGPAGALGSVTVDELMLVKDTVLPEEWFDGDTGGCEWLGPRFWSPSRAKDEAESLDTVAEWVPPFFLSVAE